ncbi:MAG: hypothetical protein PVH17_12360 [Anaerolineae bacterium]
MSPAGRSGEAGGEQAKGQGQAAARTSHKSRQEVAEKARQEIKLALPSKVTYLRDSKVWREIEIAGDQTLDDLHYAIQKAVNFDADHLYSFFLSNRAWDRSTEYSSPHADGPSATRVKIEDLRLRMKQRFLYLFDYGDEHQFEVQLVGTNLDAPKDAYPKVVARHGKAPDQYAW